MSLGPFRSKCVYICLLSLPESQVLIDQIIAHLWLITFHAFSHYHYYISCIIIQKKDDLTVIYNESSRAEEPPELSTSCYGLSISCNNSTTCIAKIYFFNNPIARLIYDILI